jgi:serine/threonine protein phosphatase PrpC
MPRTVGVRGGRRQTNLDRETRAGIAETPAFLPPPKLLEFGGFPAAECGPAGIPSRRRSLGSRMSLDYCELSDIGRRRANNQDAKAVVAPWSREQYRRRGWLLIVADGMGAHAAGEMASAMAAEHVPLAYEKFTSRSPPLALRRSIEAANSEIHARGETSPDMKGMGTTCTALVIVPRGAIVGHVGDSRAYRIRGERIDQLSRDHSLVWELQDMQAAGRGVPNEAVSAAPKNIITRSMGPHAHVDVDIEGPFPVEEDDVFVLCSDGLSGQVADEEIGLLAATLKPRAAAGALIALSLARGGPDNITVIVARATDKEVSKVSSKDEPWPLSDEADTATPTSRLPVKPLLFTAASLFAILVSVGTLRSLLPEGLLAPDAANADSLLTAAMWIMLAFSMLAFLASFTFSLLGFLVTPAPTGRFLSPKDRLGKGPYRTYRCAASKELVEGILATVETAAEGLDAAAAGKAIAAVRAARDHLATRSFTSAVEDAAAALDVYRRSVESARSDVTVRGPAGNAESNRSALDP